MQLLASFGMGFDVDELTIDEVALSEWLQAISETLVAQQALIDSLMSNEANSGMGQLDSALIADMINEAGSATTSFGERVVLKEFQETTSQELEDWFSEIPLSPVWYYGEFDFDTDGILHLEMDSYTYFEVALLPDSINLEEITVNEIWNSQIESLYSDEERSWSFALQKDEKLVLVSSDPDEHEDIRYASWLPLITESIESNETVSWACGDTLEYEGFLYPTVEMNHNCWFAKNLSYLPEVHYPTDASDQEPRYYVWEYWGTDAAEAMASPEYEEFGVYYNRSAIESGGLCPSGWETPDFYTWRQLFHAYAYQPIIESTPHFHTPRDLLDEGYEWNLGYSWQIISGVVYNGTGFGIVPSGYVNPSTTNTDNIFAVNANTRFAVKATSNFDGYPQIHIDGAWIYTYPNWGGGAISVRCIKH